MVESKTGAPKYLEGRLEVEKPRIRVMFLWVRWSIWKKKIWDLAWLMEVPEDLENTFRT